MLKKYNRYFTVKIVILIFLLFITTDVHSNQTKTIVIDPGHGGIDPGCCVNGFNEKDITLDISKTIQSLLQNKGYKVTLTRDTDISLYKLCNIGSTMPRRDLNERVNRINQSNADLFVSIHVNSFAEDPKVNGSVVYYYSMECVQSKKIAQYIQEELNNISFEGKARTPHKSRPQDYYILKKTVMSGVLIETGFITNPDEQKWFSLKEYKQKIAESISAGIEKYFSD